MMMALSSADTEASVSSFERESISDSLPEISNDSMESSTAIAVNMAGPGRRGRKTRESTVDFVPMDFTPEMMSAYKIVSSLMSSSNKHVNAPFIFPIDDKIKENRKYYTIIQNPIWLERVKTKLLELKYTTISQVVRDLRLILENCYRFYGPAHPNTKKAMKMETMLEQKLALLPRDLKQKTSLELTSPELVKVDKEVTPTKSVSAKNPQRATGWKDSSSSSVILSCVRKARAQQEREQRRQHMEEKKAEKEATHLELVTWEESFIGAELVALKSMWEVPQIGHFLYLTQTLLNIPEVSHFELERAFLMPGSSSLLATIMTSLLSSPQQRNKLDKIPAMPYRIWQARLSIRVGTWYRTYVLKDRCLLKVFEVTGVEPEFFRILGSVNPLETKKFHELTLKQRVWLVKSVCDYCLQNHKSIQEGIFESHHLDWKEYVLGEDVEENVYIHFPQFCGQSLRLYKQYVEERPMELDLSLPADLVVDIENPDEVKDEIKDEIKDEAKDEVKMEESKEDLKEESEVETPPTKVTRPPPRRGNRKRGRKKARVATPEPPEEEEEEPAKELTFQLIVDSVEALRNLADSFSNWADSVPNKKNQSNPRRAHPEKTLHNNLRSLLRELEPWEQKLEQAEKKSRFKLKKDWDAYRKRIEENIPEASENFWLSDSEEDSVQPTATGSKNSSRLPSEKEDEQESFIEDGLGLPVDAAGTSFRKTHYRRCTKQQRLERSASAVLNLSSSDDDDSESSSSDSYHVTVSSRGRIRRTKTFGDNYEEKKHSKQRGVINLADNQELELMQPNQRDMLEAHRNQNSADDAKMQYQWEQMRQKLLDSEKKDAKANNSTSSPSLASNSYRNQIASPFQIKVSTTLEKLSPGLEKLTPAIRRPPQPLTTPQIENLISPNPQFGSMKNVNSEKTPVSEYPNLMNAVIRSPPMGGNIRPQTPIITTTPCYKPATTIARKVPTILGGGVLGNKSLAFSRQIASKDGSTSRIVQTTFSKPGVLRTTVSGGNLVSPQSSLGVNTPKPPFINNNNNTLRFIQATTSSNSNSTTTTASVGSPNATRKVILVPYSGAQGTSPAGAGKTYILKVLNSTNKNETSSVVTLSNSQSLTNVGNKQMISIAGQNKSQIVRIPASVAATISAAYNKTVAKTVPNRVPGVSPLKSPVKVPLVQSLPNPKTPALPKMNHPQLIQTESQCSSSQPPLLNVEPSPLPNLTMEPPLTMQQPAVPTTQTSQLLLDSSTASYDLASTGGHISNSFPMLHHQHAFENQEIIYPSQQPQQEMITISPHPQHHHLTSSSINASNMGGQLQMAQSISTVSMPETSYVMSEPSTQMTQIPLVSTTTRVVSSADQQHVSLFTHGGLIEHHPSMISCLSNPIMSPQQQDIRTVLTQCPVQLQTQPAMQLITTNTGGQLLTSVDQTQNMIVCSSPMMGNANGYIKTTGNACANLLTAGQGGATNMFYLTNTGQLVAMDAGTTLVTENLQQI